VKRWLKFVALAVGLSAFAVLAIFGFAVWVFIPVLPAGLIFAIALIGSRRKAFRHKAEPTPEATPRKAA